MKTSLFRTIPLSPGVPCTITFKDNCTLPIVSVLKSSRYLVGFNTTSSGLSSWGYPPRNRARSLSKKVPRGLCICVFCFDLIVKEKKSNGKQKDTYSNRPAPPNYGINVFIIAWCGRYLQMTIASNIISTILVLRPNFDENMWPRRHRSCREGQI
jgi:hypothetical protein